MINEQIIRVVIIDDSALMRQAISHIIAEGRGFEIVGTAASGREGLALVKQLRPDVVTLDVEMPGMNGLQVLEHIMLFYPTPVIMLSSLTRQGADITLRCLELGAVDTITKPTGSVNEDLQDIRYLIWHKLRGAATANITGLHTRLSELASPTPAPAKLPNERTRPAKHLVTIGASTGGPRALAELLEALPGDLPAALLIVQHMPAFFTAAMAQRLNSRCALEIREAQEGDPLRESVALIAPGGQHLHLTEEARVTLTEEPPLWGVRPSVDPMMIDAARLFEAKCLGVIMTGMGRDGTAGMTEIKHRAGATIGQNEATCVVYGMPRSAFEAGMVDQLLPLPDIAPAIRHWCEAAHGRLPAKRG